MGRRGPKPKPLELIVWTPELAYAVGLIATDGCLYNDGRHINFTSKDLQLINLFKKCLHLKNRVGIKKSGFAPDRMYYNLQFGNVSLYKFLLSIGLTSAKSKTMGAIKVPDEFFRDFLRGLFDGDGSFYSYFDKRWRSSFMFYLSFISASKAHLEWLRSSLQRMFGVHGHGINIPYGNVFQLKYAKGEAEKLLTAMYHSPTIACLERKRKKVYIALSVDQKNRASARVL